MYVRDVLVLDDERISTQRQLHLVLLLAQDERVLYDSARYARNAWRTSATYSSCSSVSRTSASRSSARYNWCTERTLQSTGPWRGTTQTTINAQEVQHLRRGQVWEVQRLHRAAEVRGARRDVGPSRSRARASHALTLSCSPGRRAVPRPGQGLVRTDHEQDEARVRFHNVDVDGYDDKESLR